VSDRIVTIRLKIERYHLNVIGVYAPVEGEEENSITFYDTLQKTLDGTNKNELMVIAGDLNARIGKQAYLTA
jgi:exonuclease III